MAVVYRCPGSTGYGHGETARTVHLDGCCARFALMTDERRAETGLRTSAPEPRPEPPRPPDPETVTVIELAKIIAEMQRRDTEQPGVEQDQIVWLEIGPDDDYEQALALIELGRPYGLVAAYRRSATTTEGNPR